MKKTRILILIFYIILLINTVCTKSTSENKLIVRNELNIIKLDSSLYIKCDSPCKTSKTKSLCEFKNPAERFLLDCFKCEVNNTNCNDCYSYNNICFRMKSTEKFSYEHDLNTYHIQVAKLRSESSENSQENKEIINVENLSTMEEDATHIINNSKFKKSKLDLGNDKNNKEHESVLSEAKSNSSDNPFMLNDKETHVNILNKYSPTENIKGNSSKSSANSKESIFNVIKGKKTQKNFKKFCVIILDLSSQAPIDYFNTNPLWLKYYENLVETYNVEIITKTCEDPQVYFLKLPEDELKKNQLFIRNSFWLQDCLNYIIVSDRNPEETIIVTSGSPRDEFLYLRAVNKEKIKLILTGVTDKEYLLDFNLLNL